MTPMAPPEITADTLKPRTMLHYNRLARGFLERSARPQNQELLGDIRALEKEMRETSFRDPDERTQVLNEKLFELSLRHDARLESRRVEPQRKLDTFTESWKRENRRDPAERMLQREDLRIEMRMSVPQF